MKIITITEPEKLDNVRTYWEAWQDHPNTDFDHFKLVCQLRHEVLQPYVTVVERDRQPCALLAGRLERTYFTPSIGYLKLFRLPAKVLTILNKGLLGQVDEEIAETLVRHAWSLLSTGVADAVAFHSLPENSSLLRALLVHGSRWYCEKNPDWTTHWEMTLSEQPGFLLKKLKPKHRSWVRGRKRRLESDFPGKISWQWMSHFDDLNKLCARLEDVAALTYQRGLGVGFVDNEEYRQRFALFASRGQLRVQLLEIEGIVRAFWAGVVCKGVFHSAETGYDSDFGDYRLGTLVLLQMVDELVREGVRKLDFGLGDASYKERFGDSCWREATVRLFAPTAKGLALRSSLIIFASLNATARRLLQKSVGMESLKSAWRRLLTPSRSRAGKNPY